MRACRWVRPITAWKGIPVSYGAGCYVEYWTELIWWNITNESSEVEKVWRSEETDGGFFQNRLPPDSQCYISVAAAIRLKSAPLSWLLRGFFQNMERKQGYENKERLPKGISMSILNYLFFLKLLVVSAGNNIFSIFSLFS